jgi:ADP-ribose pyrophosphatase YjhB (NUDIX family)
MEINSSITRSSGEEIKVSYHDVNSKEELHGREVKVVHAYCFYNDKLVIVYAGKKGSWTPPGGGVEDGETIEQAVAREIKEETNMKVLAQALIGYQDIHDPSGAITQTRSVCIVEPYGDFVSDPDGDITEIKLIDPSEYKEYFDWGEIGDHVMERALILKSKLEGKF